MDFIDLCCQHLESEEARVPFMYLDTRGYVTVGVGNMLPNEFEAAKLPFYLFGKPATDEKIRAAWRKVKKMERGKVARFYSAASELRLTDEGMTLLLKRRLDTFLLQLRSIFKEFDSYPEPVRLALVDMIYNLGDAGLRNYPKLRFLIEQRAWYEASAECWRYGIPDRRNKWTVEQFKAASLLEKQA